MRRSRINYWSCSKFADWIRGTPKPFALEWGEWNNWKKEVEAKNPFRFWLAEKGLDKLQDLIYFPVDLYDCITIYISNRWINKTHMLNTGLKPGHYYEFDTRVLHGLFNELVDYVEVELAGMQTWKNEQKYKFYKGRCAEAGLDYLEWACSLKYDDEYGMRKKDKFYGKLTPQAISAQKVRDLYEWWTITRPNRPDPYVVAKYDDTISDSIFNNKVTPKQRATINKAEKMDQSYNKEDTNKLIELIKIRREIWT
jgi:hypothetical protein